MVTRRATLHIPEQSLDDGESRALSPFIEPEPPEQTDVDRVTALLQMAGSAGRASVKVYKTDNGKSVFCDSYQPQEFEDGDFKMLRDAFGAGSFKIMLYGVHPETGNFGLITRTEVTIAESRTAQRPQDGTQAGAMPAGLAQVLQSLAEGQRATLDALVSMKQTPQADPMAQMSQMLGMMAAMREAMGLNAGPAKQSPISEIVAAMREMREASAELMPKEKDDDSLSSMLPQVLGLIQTGMQTQAQPQQAAHVLPAVTLPQTLQSAPQVNNPAPQAQTQEDQMKFLELVKLRENLAALVSMAKENKPHTDGAALIYEKLPDDMIELLFAANWFEGLCIVSSEVKPYQEWLTQARALVLPMFDDASAEPEIAATGQPGA